MVQSSGSGSFDISWVCTTEKQDCEVVQLHCGCLLGRLFFPQKRGAYRVKREWSFGLFTLSKRELIKKMMSDTNLQNS